MNGRLAKHLRFLSRFRRSLRAATPIPGAFSPPPVVQQPGYAVANPGTAPIVLGQQQVARLTNNGALTSAGINVNLVNRQTTTGNNTIVLPPGGSMIINGDAYSSFSVGTSTASLFLEVGAPSFLNSPIFLGKVNAGQSGTWTVGLSAGSLVEIADSAGNVQSVILANGGTASCNGVGRALVIATASDPVTLSDGTTTGQVTVMPATAQWFPVTFPVVNGKTYTFAGTGLALLGPGITVTPG